MTENTQQQEQNYHNAFLLIPAFVADDKDLDDSTKLLFGRLSALSNQRGYSWASDKYLAELCGCQDRVIKDRLKTLEDKRYIIRVTVKKGVLWDRKIYIIPVPFSKNIYEEHAHALRSAQSCPSTGTPVPNNSISNNNITKKEQQQPAAPAVAFFNCLKDVDIPDSEKVYLSSHYSEKEVKQALSYCLHPKTKIETTLIQALKWACKNQPTLPRDIEAEKKQQQIQQDEIERIAYERKKKCEDLSKIHHNHLKQNGIKFTDREYITVDSHVEYVSIGNDKLYYKDNKFNDLIRHLIKKYNIFTGQQMKIA